MRGRVEGLQVPPLVNDGNHELLLGKVKLMPVVRSGISDRLHNVRMANPGDCLRMSYSSSIHSAGGSVSN